LLRDSSVGVIQESWKFSLFSSFGNALSQTGEVKASLRKILVPHKAIVLIATECSYENRITFSIVDGPVAKNTLSYLFKIKSV
jgi:hypothetical protein